MTKIHGNGEIRSTYEVAVTAQAYAHGGRIPQGIPQAIQDVLNHGAAKCKAGWENIPIEEHIAHAITHLADHATGNETGEPHLRHALTRVMMAVAIDEGMVEVREEMKHRAVNRGYLAEYASAAFVRIYSWFCGDPKNARRHKPGMEAYDPIDDLSGTEETNP